MDCSQRIIQGIKNVLHELQGVLLNIRKARLFQVADHVGRGLGKIKRSL